MTRVLVVHHDVDVGDIEVDALRRAGYEVDQCVGPIGSDACPVLRGEPCWQVDKADVLVYDVWAAGDGRPELIDDLRDLHPDKPVVVTSPGMMLDWVRSDGPHGVTPVRAPTGGDLVAAIERALSADAGGARTERAPAKSEPEQDEHRAHW
jgi:DNA-binding NtrC family response regulator